MLLQTRKVEFDGFDRIQEILMRVKLANIRIMTENVKITLHQCIEYGKCNYCWYGGLIATIVCGDNQFDLMANGDVIVHLLDKKTNDVLAYVKDKSNGGSFYDRMQAYIANDAHLEAIMADDDPDYALDFENNNWFEVFLNKVDNQTTDNSYVSDCENIFDAIAEMVDKIAESPEDFNYEFVVLNKPVSTLAETDANGNPILYTSGTQYKLVNEYTNSGRNIKLFYTRDGSDPTDETKRKEFKDGDVFTLTSSETLRAIYMEAVDGNSFFGPEAKYIYALKTTTGGGGGGRTIDKTRKYTKDIFGNEHPTHIGYIYGYPDGSVHPNGEITREEMTAILYRITNHAYEKPFAETGNVFPDVALGRWSAHDIEYMADKNIVYGYPDGEFKPQNNLTRAEFAALIRRFAKLEKSDKENPFPDLDKSHWAYEDILALNASGLMQG